MKKTRRRSPANRAAKKRGAPPGSAIYVGDQTGEVQVTVIRYDPEGFQETQGATHADLCALRKSADVTWVNLTGVHDVDAVKQVADAFSLHPLLVEDLLNPGSRPKAEDQGDHLFVVVKMAHPQQNGDFELEQIAVVMGPTWVLTFQEREGDLFEGIRKRVRTGTGRIRRMPADYLLHAVLDAVVDGYFTVLDELDARVMSLEDMVLDEPGMDVAREIHEHKSQLNVLRRVVRPLRDATGELLGSDEQLVTDATRPFFRDLNDHIQQVSDLLDGYRDRLTGVLELQIAVTGQRMNDVMKVLTIVATLFIPLTFIAGIYGMNFDGMPELHWRYGYPAVLGLMGLLLVGMLALLKWKRWF